MMAKWWMYVYKALCMLTLLGKAFEVLAQLRVTEVKCKSVGPTVSRLPLDKQSHGRAHRNRACGANF
jgi:hypothetical protein